MLYLHRSAIARDVDAAMHRIAEHVGKDVSMDETRAWFERNRAADQDAGFRDSVTMYGAEVAGVLGVVMATESQLALWDRVKHESMVQAGLLPEDVACTRATEPSDALRVAEWVREWKSGLETVVTKHSIRAGLSMARYELFARDRTANVPGRVVFGQYTSGAVPGTCMPKLLFVVRQD
jgi:hypothetical protein